MKHTLASSMFLPLPPEQVFAFFAAADNLARITPPAMGFRTLTQGVELGEGSLIDYRFRVFGAPLRWRSLIDRWHPPHEFRDTQLNGPYKHWVHEHRFIAERGGTTIEDAVEYEVPLQPLGELAHWLVRRKLEQIFAYRRQATARLLQPEPR